MPEENLPDAFEALHRRGDWRLALCNGDATNGCNRRPSRGASELFPLQAVIGHGIRRVRRLHLSELAAKVGVKEEQ